MAWDKVRKLLRQLALDDMEIRSANAAGIGNFLDPERTPGNLARCFEDRRSNVRPFCQIGGLIRSATVCSPRIPLSIFFEMPNPRVHNLLDAQQTLARGFESRVHDLLQRIDTAGEFGV